MYEKIKTRSPNFDLHPVFEIPQTTSYLGYDQIFNIIDSHIQTLKRPCVVVIDSYYEVNHQELKDQLIDALHPQLLIDMNNIRYSEEMIQQRLGQFITEDRINGVFITGDIKQYFDLDKIEQAKQDIQAATGLVIVYGVGAGIISRGDLFIYHNVTIQRIKDGYFEDLPNWGAHNEKEDPLTKEKRFNFESTLIR